MQGRRPPWILVETELYRYPPSRHPGRFRKFWCLCVFFWYGLTTSMTFSQALGFPIHLNLATNKIPMFFLIAWLRKDRKKLELDTHTHTQILWMEEVLQQLGFINHVSKHMVETCHICIQIRFRKRDSFMCLLVVRD